MSLRCCYLQYLYSPLTGNTLAMRSLWTYGLLCHLSTELSLRKVLDDSNTDLTSPRYAKPQSRTYNLFLQAN